MGMAGVAATVVLAAFDSTIISTTLPRVAEALNGMALYAWVGTGYLLATAASIMIFGRLGDMFGRKPLMLVSVLIIALGSIACGLSQSMGQLILFRTLQGIGGGMMIATAFAAPADLFPDAKQRVKWMALVSAAFAMASGIGPVLGGAATQALGWRAAFSFPRLPRRWPCSCWPSISRGSGQSTRANGASIGWGRYCWSSRWARPWLRWNWALQRGSMPTRRWAWDWQWLGSPPSPC